MCIEGFRRRKAFFADAIHSCGSACLSCLMPFEIVFM